MGGKNILAARKKMFCQYIKKPSWHQKSFLCELENLGIPLNK